VNVGESADNLLQARGYLQAIESGADFDEIAKFLAPGIVLEILPNRLQPSGSRDDLAGMRRSSERGKRVMTSQRYEIRNELATGDQVGLEVDWVGTLAMPYESIPGGGQMRARFAMFLRFREGKIISQRNYDCFEPW
jgi:ketosteroid isomerase-like protein